MNNDFVGNVWGDLPMIFTSVDVTSENRGQITSRVPQNSIFTVTNVFFFNLHAVFCPEHTIPLKTITDRPFRNCHQGRYILT